MESLRRNSWAIGLLGALQPLGLWAATAVAPSPLSMAVKEKCALHLRQIQVSEAMAKVHAEVESYGRSYLQDSLILRALQYLHKKFGHVKHSELSADVLEASLALSEFFGRPVYFPTFASIIRRNPRFGGWPKAVELAHLNPKSSVGDIAFTKMEVSRMLLQFLKEAGGISVSLLRKDPHKLVPKVSEKFFNVSYNGPALDGWLSVYWPEERLKGAMKELTGIDGAFFTEHRSYSREDIFESLRKVREANLASTLYLAKADPRKRLSRFLKKIYGWDFTGEAYIYWVRRYFGNLQNAAQAVGKPLNAHSILDKYFFRALEIKLRGLPSKNLTMAALEADADGTIAAFLKEQRKTEWSHADFIDGIISFYGSWEDFLEKLGQTALAEKRRSLLRICREYHRLGMDLHEQPMLSAEALSVFGSLRDLEDSGVHIESLFQKKSEERRAALLKILRIANLYHVPLKPSYVADSGSIAIEILSRQIFGESLGGSEFLFLLEEDFQTVAAAYKEAGVAWNANMPEDGISLSYEMKKLRADFSEKKKQRMWP